MQITSGSTAYDDQQRARRLPPDLLAKTNKDLDELVQLRKEKAAAQQRGKHAGSARSNRTRRAIIIMVWQRRKQLRNWTKSQPAKCMWLQSQIAAAIKLSTSEPKQWQQLTRAPHVRTIFKVIKDLRM